MNSIFAAVDPDIQAILENVDAVWGVVMPLVAVIVGFGVCLFFVNKLKGGGGSFRDTRAPDSERDPMDDDVPW